jgi:hypothetical protein
MFDFHDDHLNIFRSYNRDNELIENNLTRALIITLQYLSPLLRNSFLHLLLSQHFNGNLPNFSKAKFALQNHMPMEMTQACSDKFILTIATESLEEIKSKPTSIIDPYISIPDGWIYNFDHGFCYLIEAKLNWNSLSNNQLASHAKWLGYTIQEFHNHTITIQWFDILETIREVLRNGSAPNFLANEQEASILYDLEKFLGMFGYRVFEGFSLDKIPPKPKIKLFGTESRLISHNRLSLKGLNPIPFIHLAKRTEGGSNV